MDYQALFKEKLLSIPEAVSLVQSHQTIGMVLPVGTAGLLTELGNHKDRLEDVRVWVVSAAAFL